MSQHAPIECPGKDGEEWVLCTKDKLGKRRTIAHVYDEAVKDQIVRAVNCHDDLLAALKGVCRLYELGVDHETPSVGQALRNAADAIHRAEQGG